MNLKAQLLLSSCLALAYDLAYVSKINQDMYLYILDKSNIEMLTNLEITCLGVTQARYKNNAKQEK